MPHIKIMTVRRERLMQEALAHDNRILFSAKRGGFIAGKAFLSRASIQLLEATGWIVRTNEGFFSVTDEGKEALAKIK